MRSIEPADATRECPFPEIDDEVYELYKSALAQDIGQLKGILSVKIDGSVLLIKTKLSKDALLEHMKPFFSRDFCYIRLVNIEKEV